MTKDSDLATQGQQRLIRSLIRATGSPMSNRQANMLKVLTQAQASSYIFELRALEALRAPETPGLATRRQAAYWAELRSKAGKPVTQAEAQDFRKLTTKEANSLTVQTMRAYQDFRDSKNLPMAPWRLERGLHGLNGPVRTRKAEQA